jgi:hypothetical protein
MVITKQYYIKSKVITAGMKNCIVIRLSCSFSNINKTKGRIPDLEKKGS